MSDRQVFDTGRSGAGTSIGRGKYVARLRTDAVGRSFGGKSYHVASTPTNGGKIAIPEASVSRSGKVTFNSGAGGFGTARDLGLSSMPVAMSMKSWRNAARAGLISGEGLGKASNEGKRRSASSGPFTITIDTMDLWRIGEIYGGVAVSLRTGQTAISRAINFGMRRFRTHVKRDLVRWTGLPTATVDKTFRINWATPATLTGVLQIRDRHHMIARNNFGAKHSRSDPGGTHRAWNRPQLAVSSFLIPGRQPLFRREGRSRFPVAPLWGPNSAREIDRHQHEVMARLNLVNGDVKREAERLVRVALSRRR